MEIKKIQVNQLTIYYIPDTKFKTLTIGAFFFSPLDENELTQRAILSNYMTKFNQVYPSEQEFSRQLKELYGAELYCNYGKNGLTTSMNFCVRTINDKYLNDHSVDLFQKAVEMLQITLIQPYFDTTLVETEKELLIQDLKRLYDNKSQYATRRFIDIMHANEKCRFPTIGNIESAKQVTVDSLKQAYENILRAKRVIYVIGEVAEEKIKTAFEQLVLPDETVEQLEFMDYETKEIQEVTEVIEDQKNRQSIALMGYRSEIRIKDQLYDGMLLLSAMLGEFFHSTLFQEIREKRSLAYSVNADYNGRKGNFAIYAGINANAYQEFKQVVQDIIARYQQGEIDDKVMDLTKKALINGIYKTADRPGYGLQMVLNEIMDFKNTTIEEKVQKIERITKEEVTEAAKALQLDTIYLLRGTL